jgi:DNA-binding GntR family transcriptional regulator
MRDKGKLRLAPPPSRPRERSRTLKQAIYQQLRERIIFQDLKAGEFVNETRLAQELGVSRTVLREIIARLVSDGLLVATPGQGAYVQGIDLLMIKSAYEMRIPLEGLAGRLAAERAQPTQLEALRELLRRAETAKAQPDYRELARLDWEFHRIIGEMTQNDLLATTLQRLLLPFNRLWYLAMIQYGQIGNWLQELQTILDAVAVRSAPAAEKALVDHMVATPAVIRPVLALEQTR